MLSSSADLCAHLHAEGLDPGDVRAAHQRAERALAAVLQGNHDITAAALDLIARKLISRGLVSTRELRGELLDLLLLSLFVALIRRTCLLSAAGCQCHCSNDRCRADRSSLPSSKQSHWFPPFPPKLLGRSVSITYFLYSRNVHKAYFDFFSFFIRYLQEKSDASASQTASMPRYKRSAAAANPGALSSISMTVSAAGMPSAPIEVVSTGAP